VQKINKKNVKTGYQGTGKGSCINFPRGNMKTAQGVGKKTLGVSLQASPEKGLGGK
jgi:hypothetical protein